MGNSSITTFSLALHLSMVDSYWGEGGAPTLHPPFPPLATHRNVEDRRPQKLPFSPFSSRDTIRVTNPKKPSIELRMSRWHVGQEASHWSEMSPRLDASMAAELRISAVNEQDYEAFIQTFGNVVENCSLCAAAVWASRPFSNFDELYYKFCGFIDDLSAIGREGILRSHPDLAGWLAKMDALTPESKMEQSRAGLNTLSMEERESLEEYNRKYREKFGFPFVICARLNKEDTILEGIQTRLGNSAEQELEAGVREVKKIMLLRLKNVLDSEDSKL